MIQEWKVSSSRACFENVPANEWPHTTSDTCLKEAVGVDLFNEVVDGEVQTAIYVRFCDGSRFPGRTVAMRDTEYAKTVLAAWTKNKIVIDYREQEGV